MNQVPNFSFHHSGISVPNLKEAIEWYENVLGFEVEMEFYIDKIKSQTAMLKRGELRFEVFQLEDAQPLPDDRRYPNQDLKTHGNKHVAFLVDNLDEFLGHIESKEAEVAMTVSANGNRACFIRDCAGNLIEFVQLKSA